MAETGSKRQNAGGKAPIATPKSTQNAAPTTAMSLEDALNGAIGSSIRLQTTNPHRPTLEGTLFTICPLTNLLAVTTSSPNPSHHVIPVSSIKDFTLLSGPTPALPSLTHISTAALQARANDALARRKEMAARINKNVSREAQDLFDSLDRHSKVQWLGNDILIYSEVVVKAPGYKVEDCKGVRSDVSSKVVERVKKVIESEHKRVADKRDKKPPKPVIPAVPAIPAFSGQRKGG